ncbi:MAG: DUF2905 domain-containing protein [Bacillaceae bacterium]|nr:DUF2905 domain-containing protein [Bacillaceae bacterium]
MSTPAKVLITVGIVLVVIGLLWQIGGKYIPIGKLPGDILLKRGNATFYFPIVSSIVVSIVLSLILFLINKFK